jgi:sortase (surface protein transpeptidase)
VRGLLAALAVAALVGACSSPITGQGIPAAAVAPSTAAGAPLSPVSRAAPSTIDIPRIDAHSSLIPLGLAADGSLTVPDVAHPQQAGWYCADPKLAATAISCRSGVLPGQVGPAVIVGHVDGSPADGAHQKGVFYRLRELAVGDTARVTLADGTVLTFAVYRVLTAAKTAFPTSVVYGDTQTPELRLITCGGAWVGGKLGYADNTIAFATLIPTVPA